MKCRTAGRTNSLSVENKKSQGHYEEATLQKMGKLYQKLGGDSDEQSGACDGVI